jgi:uncharacterized membrane protein
MKKLISFPLALPFFIILLLLPFFLLAIAALLGLVAADLASKALGLTPVKALVIYLAILLGSLFNIPVYEFKSPGRVQPPMLPYMGARYKLPSWLGHRTILAVNVGGCIIPAALSIYFALGLPLISLLLTTVVVTLGVYYFSRPVRSVGIMTPVLVPPLLAVVVSLIALHLYGGGYGTLARLAFASGVFGTILGADVMHLPGIRKMGPDFVSIGGAGTFDGILLTGIIATVLAVIITSF